MATVVGAAILFASYAAMLAVLPNVPPFEVLHCNPASPAQAPLVSSCFSSLSPVYPATFVVSILSTVVLFSGAFGRRFVVSPTFVAGMVALEYGLAGTVSALLDARSGVARDPLIFALPVAIGAAALCFHAYRWLHPRKVPIQGAWSPAT
jgi:hypothetical protein